MLIGTEGSSGWPDIIPGAYRAFPFQCARLSDAWPTLGDAVAAHVALGVRVHLLVEDWTTSPSTIIATLTRYPALEHVELGNEDSYSYKNSGDVATMRTKAGNYARAIVALRSALDAAGLTRVGIICQNDYALWSGSTWVDAMYAAVPNLHTYVRAWCLHPYTAGREVERIRTAISQAEAHGCPTNFPVWLTEWGIATSGGTALDDNYGHPLNLTYSQTATLITSTITDIAKKCPSVERLHWFQMIDGGTDATRREQNFGFLIRDRSWTPKPSVPGALASMVGFAPKVFALEPWATGTTDAFGLSVRSLVVSRPYSALKGDRWLIVAFANASTPTFGRDVTVLRSGRFGNLYCAVGWRTDDGSSSTTVSLSSSDPAAGAAAITYASTDPVAPFVAGSIGSGTGLRWTAPGLSTTIDHTLVELLAAYNWTLTGSPTFPSDFPYSVVGGGAAWYGGARAYSPAAATGDEVVTAASSQTTTDWLAFLVAAQPPRAQVVVRTSDGGARPLVPWYHDGSGARLLAGIGIKP